MLCARLSAFRRGKNPVTAYFSSDQLLRVGFAEQTILFLVPGHKLLRKGPWSRYLAG